MMEFADTILRGAAIGAMALTALSMLRLRPVGFRPAIAVALAASMIVYAVISSPVAPDALDSRFLHALPVINPVLLWLFGLSLFDDGFRLRLWHAVPAALTVLTAFIEPVQPLRAAVVGGLYIHLIWIAWSTGPDDLVAARLVFRRWFLGLAAVTGLAITFVEVASPQPGPALSLAQAAALAALSGGFLHWSHRLAVDLWPAARPPQAPSEAPDPLLERLNAAMAAEVWRTEGLTIGALAQRLDAPEHRLRRLINQRLGHRNFASFINAARVAAAVAALSDPAQADKQILTIAYESGFASLGPFNRAFRAETGVSPGEWRAGARRN